MKSCNRPRSSGHLVVGLVLAVFCFGFLPLLANWEPVAKRIEWLEEKQINGGATFYTDQPFLTDALIEWESELAEE